MNFLCAILLLHTTEETAFWTFSGLIENILPPGYFTPTLEGSRAEQLTFLSCLSWKLPHVMAHLEALGVILEPFVCPWFLCLYVNSLTFEASLRCVFFTPHSHTYFNNINNISFLF